MQAHQWVLDNMDKWVEKYLIADNSIRIRNGRWSCRYNYEKRWPCSDIFVHCDSLSIYSNVRGIGHFKVARETGSRRLSSALWDSFGGRIFNIATNLFPKTVPQCTLTTISTRSPAQLQMANRPLPTFKKPHFQNKAKCTTFLVEMSFIYMRMKTHFHIKGWALNLVLIQRPRGTRKWPIASQKISRATWKPDHCLWILFFVFLQPQRICLWVLFPTITSDRDSGECLCQIPFFDVHSNTFLLGWCLLPP